MRKKSRKHKNRSTVLAVLVATLVLLAAAVLFLIYGFGLPGREPTRNTDGTVYSSMPSSPNSSPKEGAFAIESRGQNPDVVGPSSSTNEDRISDMLKGMTLEEKVGQLLIVGVEGPNSDEYSNKLIEEYHVGGFILFKKNIQDSSQLVGLLNSLKKTNSLNNKVPLFLSVDEEGGRVSRLPGELKKLPSNRVIGGRNDTKLSYKIGSLLGDELKAFGFNVDFAPVLDINSNPKNPVIGDRAFGAEPELVTSLGVQTMKGIQDQGVIAGIKHFPGHGDTSVDSHLGLPKVKHTLERLESFELIPFKKAIDSGADVVMIAHILLPELDAANPASFSRAVITDLLRTRMSYNGVVITDDFTMGAIVKNYDMAAAAVKSIQAGGDIVLVCHEFSKQEAVLKALLDAARTGELSQERIDESVYRILSLKHKYGLVDAPIQEIDIGDLNNKITSVLK